MSCAHHDFRCLGYYVPISSYMCTKCGEVFICECYKEIAEHLLPTQLLRAREFGTDVEYKIQGFLPNLCESCKGEPELPRPMRYGNKIDRYYWREIKKTYYQSILDWLKDNELPIQPIWEIEKKYSKVSDELKRKAKETWKDNHEKNPKYDTKEPSQEHYIENIHAPIVEIQLESSKRKQGMKKVKQWIVDTTPFDTIESAVARYYENRGYKTWFCEMKLIASLIGVFGLLAKNYDPGIRLSYNHLTTHWEERSWVKKDELLNNFFQHGTREKYLKQELEVNNLLKVLSASNDLSFMFESLLRKEKTTQRSTIPVTSLRERLGGEGEYSIKLTKDAIKNIPKKVINTMVDWAIKDYYARRGGWPDILCTKPKEYKFVEVKSPRDKIRQEQFEWFNWASEHGVHCELCIVKEKKVSKS